MVVFFELLTILGKFAVLKLVLKFVLFSEVLYSVNPEGELIYL